MRQNTGWSDLPGLPQPSADCWPWRAGWSWSPRQENPNYWQLSSSYYLTPQYHQLVQISPSPTFRALLLSTHPDSQALLLVLVVDVPGRGPVQRVSGVLGLPPLLPVVDGEDLWQCRPVPAQSPGPGEAVALARPSPALGESLQSLLTHKHLGSQLTSRQGEKIRKLVISYISTNYIQNGGQLQPPDRLFVQFQERG